MDFYHNQQREFIGRHIGPNATETEQMLQQVGVKTLDELIEKTVPASIRLQNPLSVSNSMSEYEYLMHIHELGKKNTLHKDCIGMGYYGTITPSVILRNLFENPGWYTQYTPYQAEIAQGRLESLLNFQTMVSDLTGLPIANASLLDEATAAAEAMTMLNGVKGKDGKHRFFIDNNTFAQTCDVMKTRALPVGVELVFGDYKTVVIDNTFFGALVQYPNAEGNIEDYKTFIQQCHQNDCGVVMACDILSLVLLTPPGELGADVAIGNSQRFGVPMGFGGPHAAFFATKDEYKRVIPGRIIGVSIDVQGNRCLRMALQTREQHIRREKATSNICTAQALLANMAAMYAVYHGPDGLRGIAKRISLYTQALANALGNRIVYKHFFDTLKIATENAAETASLLESNGFNVRVYQDNKHIGISLDETILPTHVEKLASLLNGTQLKYPQLLSNIPDYATRVSEFLTHPVFNSFHSESKLMRYLKKLEDKDLALNRSMISLGSCTMKLNAASEMIPVSNPHWGSLHPFAPSHQWLGYRELIATLEKDLSAITGFDACSLQPNSGAQGEYAGLLVIKAYHENRGDHHRNVILIPISAHGTNPASAAMCGYKIVIVACDDKGNIDVNDMREKAILHKDNLAGLMVTYPSTHGVFEETIIEICSLIHENGGQVYMDGANMNAQVGLTSPGNIGADVCHLNLHKTFAIPHGGGGPGMGPICVKSHLAPFLPSHPIISTGGDTPIHAVSAAPYGSASILLISYAYIKMLGAEGLKKSTEYAILNANYMKSRLEKAFKILYTGNNNTCAHEFIVDLRSYKAAGIEAEDVAKRLMDFGFHAPTLSFPVAGTLMIEPTESEDKAELDRFCDALLTIKEEIDGIVNGTTDSKNNVLKHAPHSLAVITADTWDRPYSRLQAAYPLPWVKEQKFWPSVSRVNNTHGDRNLICTCEPTSSYA